MPKEAGAALRPTLQWAAKRLDYDPARAALEKHLKNLPVDELVRVAVDALRTLRETQSERNEAKNAVREARYHDSRTGLFNKEGLLDRFKALLEEMNRASHMDAVAVNIDLNGLKPINDTYGHEAGDAAISIFSSRLKELLRPYDCVARIGGDEFFLLIVPAPDDERGATDFETLFFNRLQEGLQGLFVSVRDQQENEEQRPLTASLGVVHFTSQQARGAIDCDAFIEEIMRCADMRMYHHKKECKKPGRSAPSSLAMS